jgi:hypothetical protein
LKQGQVGNLRATNNMMNGIRLQNHRETTWSLPGSLLQPKQGFGHVTWNRATKTLDVLIRRPLLSALVKGRVQK